MRGLLEAWVARLAECRLEQKAGYDQHASIYNCNPPFYSEIFNLLFQMKKDAYAESSIEFTRKALSFLAKNADLSNPETVKAFIADHNVSDHYKRNLCIAYNKYVKTYDLTWSMPLYRQPNHTYSTQDKTAYHNSEKPDT